MAATEVPAVTPETESAPVEQEVSLQERLNNATEAEYETWERTGEFPAIKPKAEPKIETPPAKKEASAVSTAEPSATEDETKVETAPVTEPGKPQKKRTGDARILQLLEENKREREQWEARYKELEERIAKPAAADVNPGSSPAADGKAEIKASDKAPQLGDVNPMTGKPYQTIAEWQEDYSTWLLAKNSAEVEARFTKTEQQRVQAEQERVANLDWSTKVVSAREKHGDFDTIALNPELDIPRYSPADLFIRNSPHGAEVLYYLGQHPEVLKSFLRELPRLPDGNRRWEDAMHPSLQYAELARIEARLTGTTVAATTAAQPKPVTSAPAKPLPPPPTVLSAKNTVSGDPVEEAVKTKNFADYEKAANAAERKARRA